MIKVAIDCRYIGFSGIGRYLEGILQNLDFKNYDIYLVGRKEVVEKYQNASYIINNDSPFSIKGILKFNASEVNKCDYFYTPNFIIPYHIKTKVISVIHDVIFLDIKDVNKNSLEYRLKKHLFKRCMKKSIKVFSVSEFSKSRITYYFKKYESKVSVVYPGVSNIFKTRDNYQKENHIIFVGNVKKNKGLITLLKAYEIVRNKSDLKLFIIGDKESFKNKDKSVDNYLNTPGVTFTGRISDASLKKLVSTAKFLIQPSTYEGFGSPPMEAMYLNTRPIISDIEVFKEVYKDLDVVFFKNLDYNDLAQKILNEDYNFKNNIDYIENKFNYKNGAIKLEEEFR